MSRRHRIYKLAEEQRDTLLTLCQRLLEFFVSDEEPRDLTEPCATIALLDNDTETELSELLIEIREAVQDISVEEYETDAA